VLDETRLAGSWDFDLTWTMSGNGVVGDGGHVVVTMSDAINKLGLKLEKRPVPTPVLVVDRVNQTPTANAPDLARLMPPIPLATRFDVATVKPSRPGSPPQGLRVYGEQLTMRGVPIVTLLDLAFFGEGRQRRMPIVGIPVWAGSELFDVVAKAPPNTAPLGGNTLKAPLLALLKERFKLAYHMEQRPDIAYTLEAAAPRMKKADPATRSSCKYAAAPAGSRGGSQMLVCQNITVAQFADWLLDNAHGIRMGPITDATGIRGGWDLSLTFNLQGNGPRPPLDEPTGGYDMFRALEKQAGLNLRQTKKPQPVIVIDHIERKPTPD